MKMKRKMIDPPEGWMYGFPKEIPEDVDVTTWLVANGYPEKAIASFGDYFYCRFWHTED
jgi:hypothetical protein